MTTKYKILIADDEDVFLNSTADVLRENGYECDCVNDAESALMFIDEGDYHLLISDINMPGNTGLEFIRDVSQSSCFLPVILMTGYPSVETASHSVTLPVISYLVKPVDLEDLLHWVDLGVKAKLSFSSMNNMRLRLREWDEELGKLQTTLGQSPAHNTRSSVEMFVTNSFNNLATTMLEMKHLISAALNSDAESDPIPCHLLNCPHYTELTRAITDTIETLEKTKNSFKSKELGDLRGRLKKYVEPNRVG